MLAGMTVYVKHTVEGIKVCSMQVYFDVITLNKVCFFVCLLSVTSKVNLIGI